MQVIHWLFEASANSTPHWSLIQVHIVTALTALVIAPVAMLVRKGGDAHRTWGKVYFWAMMVANATALVLLFWRWNIFLFGVTILAGYSAISGYRVLYHHRPLRRDPAQRRGPNAFDWTTALLALATGIALLVTGASGLLGNLLPSLPLEGSTPFVLILLPLIFGFFILDAARTDLVAFRQHARGIEMPRRWWFFQHMNAMLGSYVGLLTAFAVQRVGMFLPVDIAWIVWVAPAVVGSVLIGRWMAHYRRQLEPAPVAATASVATH